MLIRSRNHTQSDPPHPSPLLPPLRQARSAASRREEREIVPVVYHRLYGLIQWQCWTEERLACRRHSCDLPAQSIPPLPPASPKLPLTILPSVPALLPAKREF